MDVSAVPLGQLFVVGCPDAYPDREFLRWWEREHIGGLILFEHNGRDHGALGEVLADLRRRSRLSEPLIAIDQEGGRVSRLRGHPVELRAVADYGRSERLDEYLTDYAASCAYMRRLGINCNLAPVGDVFVSADNACLRSRCFSDDPQVVSRFVAATVRTARANGLISCVKHFPGLGPARSDPHLATPVLDYSIDQWRARERQPFAAAIAERVEMVMTTHVVVSGWDRTIATGSRSMVQERLRSDLGFSGVVITDDLLMNGAGQLGDIGHRAVAALVAGHDLLLFGRQVHQAMVAYEAVREAVRRGDVDPERVKRALGRVAALKSRLS
jgi:beta-N-acetylhexosaminidase